MTIGTDRRTLLLAGGALIAAKAQPSVTPQAFGARVDGRHDDRPAIQAAIDHLSLSGGGTLVFPEGEYVLFAPELSTLRGDPPATAGHLLIQSSGVHLQGAGKTRTCLRFRGPGGGDPRMTWQVANGKVWRGPAIRIHGGERANARVSNICIEGMTLDGGAGYTGDDHWPARLSDGDGWDLTHKGVYVTADRYVGHVTIRDCVLRSFRGELIYQGGPYGEALEVTDCELFDSNADGISSSMANTVLRCHIHRIAFTGVECVYYDSPSIYAENSIENCDGEGISLTSARPGLAKIQTVQNNRLTDCRVGLLATNPYGLAASGNRLLDCGWAEPKKSNRAIWLRDDGPEGGADHVRLDNTLLVVARRPLTTGLILEAYHPDRWRDIRIGALRVEQTEDARRHSFRFEQVLDRGIGSEVLDRAMAQPPSPASP